MRASSIAFALLLAGCAGSGDEGMFILNNTAPTGTTCALTSDPSQPFLAHGSLVANMGVGYLLTPLVESRIDNPMMDTATRTIHIEGANVVLSKADTSGTLTEVTKFTSLVSGSIPPLDTINVSFEIIPASVAATPGEYSANVTMFGTLGGGRIDSAPFNYPVTVCENCIVRISPTACPLTGTPMTGNPCNPFQDGIVDCCMSGSTLLCPGPTM